MLFLAKAVATAFLGWQAWDGLNRLQERRTTFAKALATARHRGKPLLIVGLPYGMYGCGSAADGDVVLDLRTLRQCPNQVQGSVEDLTRWSEKHFGAAFVSHVVEHTCDPRRAVAELEGAPLEEARMVRFDTDIDAYIPADYVSSEPARVDIHHRLAGISIRTA